MTTTPIIDALTPEQIAQALGCTVDHINELAAANALPAVRYGRSWRFPAAAVNQYLARQALEHVRPLPGPAPAAAPAQSPARASRQRPLPDLAKAARQ